MKGAEEVFDACKVELKEIKETFDSFEMSDKKVEEIQLKSKALQEKLDPMVNEYKLKLQGNKSHRFEGKEIKINEVFGTLETFNFDLRAFKVIQF